MLCFNDITCARGCQYCGSRFFQARQERICVGSARGLCRLYHAERLMDRCAFQTENTLCIYRIVFTDPVRMSGRIAVRRTGYSVSLSFSYCCTYSVNSKAKNRRRHYAFSPRLSKKPSRITIAPSGVHGGRGRIFAAENPVFRAASLPCSFAPGNLKDFSKNW